MMDEPSADRRSEGLEQGGVTALEVPTLSRDSSCQRPGARRDTPADDSLRDKRRDRVQGLLPEDTE